MSSQKMRQLIESLEKVKVINESYEDRVKSVVSALNKEYPDGVTKKNIEYKIDQVASKYNLNIHELRQARPGLNQKIGDSRKDFIKDVTQQITFRRDTSKADKKRERVNQVLLRLSELVEDAVGNAFPDGDPFDQIFPAARKLGVPPNDVLEWLDRAVKKHLGMKDYHTYLATVWDDYISQTSDTLGPRDNPWR